MTLRTTEQNYSKEDRTIWHKQNIDIINIKAGSECRKRQKYSQLLWHFWHKWNLIFFFCVFLVSLGNELHWSTQLALLSILFYRSYLSSGKPNITHQISSQWGSFPPSKPPTFSASAVAHCGEPLPLHYAQWCAPWNWEVLSSGKSPCVPLCSQWEVLFPPHL